ncbi:MAG: hypothetical protein Q8Q08_01075 [Candidatus Omnitrophota bacterium]|nr:hypothetical protein [Candidatus Omnitrophota bacterium]MDZ4241266.1 hypothetical protein [Candidatus Omnitrophota bacterium]
MRISKCFQWLVLAGMLALAAGWAVAAEPEGSLYTIQKHPVLGKMFSWGMSQEQIQDALKAQLDGIDTHKFLAKTLYNQVPVEFTFVTGEDGLMGFVMSGSFSPAQLENELDVLTGVYGQPVAQSSGPQAMQWRDSDNDVGILWEKDPSGHSAVLLMFRKIKKAAVSQKYGPDKISVFQGLYLGMSKEEFLKVFTLTKVRKLSDDMYAADITLNLAPANVVFGFQEGGVLRAMVSEILPSRDDDEAVKKEFGEFTRWMAEWYGEPTTLKDLAAFWEEEGVSQIGYGWKEDTRSFMLIFNKI